MTRSPGRTRPGSSRPARPASWRTRLVSAAVGLVATAVDLLALAVLVGLLGVPARAANVPALLGGVLVQFFGNRHVAFRAADRPVGRQAAWFALSEIVTLALNALLYDAVARVVPLGAAGAVVLRLACSGCVFLGWSYPVWRRIFAPAAPGLAAPPSTR